MVGRDRASECDMAASEIEKAASSCATIPSTTGSQTEHFVVELFCGITPLCARPTGETLRGIYRRPGERRGARRPARASEGLLHGVAAARRTKEHRADGGTTRPAPRSGYAPVSAPFGRQGPLERSSTAGSRVSAGIARHAEAWTSGGLDHR